VRSLTTRITAAAGVAAGCAAFGTVRGLLEGRAEIGAQGWAEIGFAHLPSRELARCAVEGLRAGIDLGLRWGAAVLAVAVALAFFPRLDPHGANLLALARSRVAVAWAVAAFGAVAILGLVALERELGWIGAGQLAYALAWWLAASAALLATAWRARREPDESRARAFAAASCAALAILAIAGGWMNREGLGALRDDALPVLDVLLAAVALATFASVKSEASRATRRLLPPGAALVAALAMLALVPVALALVRRQLPAYFAREPLNVLVIGLDTTRADCTSLYGPARGGRDTTPNLRALAERGWLFDNAVSQAPWTMPAFASTFTGKYPHEHGAFSLAGVLRAREVTLAEILAEAGYATRGVVSHSYVDAHRGFAQGFDVYDSSNSRGHDAATSRSVTDRAIEFLDELAGPRPFLLFAHYFDPHYEYLSHDGWDWGDRYGGWLARQLEFTNLQRNASLVGEEELDFLVGRYEEEIAFTDREVGRLLDALAARGLAERTIVVVVADHGEAFLDRGNFGHTIDLHEEQIRVPLIVAPPKVERGMRIADVVETRAVFATVLDLVGAEFAPDARTASLARLVEGGAAPREAFSITWLPDALPAWGKRFCLSALRDGRWKLIRDFTRDRWWLYDLESDPGETRDVASEQPALAQSLRARLETWTAAQQNLGPSATVPMSAAQLEQLAKLGYTGGKER
jgi:arylsulfatase A-like enzyme